MRRLKKSKGFTLTELAIVIAVIAILIAVLVPTFTSIINKANESVDSQTTKNINTALSTYEADNGKPSDIDEVKEALAEAGFSSNLEPATNGYYYYWNSEYNIVMLIEISNQTWNLIYPTTDEAEDALTNGKANCYNINANGTNLYQDAIVSLAQSGGEIKLGAETSSAASSSKKVASKAVAAATSTSMSGLIYSYSDFVAAANITKETFKGATITLTSDINLTSTDPVYNFQGTFNGNGNTITIAAGGIDIKDGEDGTGYLYAGSDKYTFGLFASLTNNGTVKNLTVEYKDTVTDATKGTTLSAKDPLVDSTAFGGIVGFLNGGTISGCTVTGSIVQYNGVGGIVGASYSGNITNCTVEADITSIPSSEDSDKSHSKAGGIVSFIGSSSASSIVLNISGCVVGTTSSESTQTITAYDFTGGVVAHITLGTDEVNFENCTIQNISVSSTKETTAFTGAVCGKLESNVGIITISGKTANENEGTHTRQASGNVLRGTATVDNVNVTNHYYSTITANTNNSTSLWYVTSSSSAITAKTYNGQTLQNTVGNDVAYTIIIGLYKYTTDVNRITYEESSTNGVATGDTYSDLTVTLKTSLT